MIQKYFFFRETSAQKLAEMLASASASAELVETENGVRMQVRKKGEAVVTLFETKTISQRNSTRKKELQH